MISVITQRNRRYVFALFLSFSMPAAVFATPSPWQGPYLGAYLGGASGNHHVSSNASSVTETSYFTTAADVNAVSNAGTWRNEPGKMLAGIVAGHDWTWNQLLYGVAFDYSTLPMSSSNTVNNVYPDNTDQYSVYTSMRTNWLFTLRGRLGFHTVLYLPSLFYLTGGAAATQIKTSNRFSDNSAFAGVGSSNTAQNQIGWTAGAGIEVGVYNHLTVGFEYLYVDVPSVKTMSYISNTEGGFGIPTQSISSSLSTTANFHANIFKIGLNYRFDE